MIRAVSNIGKAFSIFIGVFGLMLFLWFFLFPRKIIHEKSYLNSFVMDCISVAVSVIIILGIL